MSKWILAISAMAMVHSVEASVSHTNNSQQIRKFRVVDEAVIAVRTPKSVKTLSELYKVLNSSELRKILDSGTASIILSTPQNKEYRTLVEWKAANSHELREQAGILEDLSYVEWVRPNYRYEGEARDFVRIKDPMFPEQLHHDILQSQLAWMFSFGSKEIVVAVTDDGVDIDHEDLQSNIWINKGEIPNNGIDDDNNGYVDDVNGWDFSSDDNDPRPSLSPWGGDHGTHVAGIIASAGNSKGIIGTAPKVKVMPIRFYGSGAWTSSLIAKSYAYAVDNGARIISTSYNIDGMVDDPIFQEAIAYVYKNQVLHFNSAGNGYARNPRRQELDELIIVCSTEVNPQMRDLKSDFSNWGAGIDICAPGSDILSTIPNNSYANMSGTSMAAPNAAAVAALIWSLNPTWTRDQVVAQLFSGAENIDSLNKGFEFELGAGRVNSFRSLAFKAPPPRIDEVELVEIGDQVIALKVKSKSVFRSDTIENQKNWTLMGKTEAGIVEIPLRLDRSYKIGTNEFFLELEQALPSGQYQFVARSGGLRDPFHQALDGDFDGKAGGDYVFDFTFEAPPPPEPEPEPQPEPVGDPLSGDNLHAKSGL